jgi:hypothetical protein
LQEAAQITVLQPLAAGDDRYVDLSPGQESHHLLLRRQWLEDIAERPGDPVRENDYTNIVFSSHRGQWQDYPSSPDRCVWRHDAYRHEQLATPASLSLIWLSNRLVQYPQKRY